MPGEAGELPPLPAMKVVREDYCSQDITDKAIALVEAQRPDLIWQMMREEHWREQDYRDAAWEILEYLDAANVGIPATPLGRMDLIAEFTRRGRSAYGLPELYPRGRPLTAALQQPLPPLTDKELSEHTRKFAHVTQDLVDRVLRQAWETQPYAWFEVAEEYRYEILLDATVLFREILRQILNADFSGETNMWVEMDVFDEAIMRIYGMCGIETA
jgi:hypothetical protein